MKRTICSILFLALSLYTISGNALAGTPHNAYGKIFYSDLTVPADGEITFNAFITSRPGEVLTESSTGCGYDSGYWYVAIGNFPTDISSALIEKLTMGALVDIRTLIYQSTLVGVYTGYLRGREDEKLSIWEDNNG